MRGFRPGRRPESRLLLPALLLWAALCVGAEDLKEPVPGVCHPECTKHG